MTRRFTLVALAALAFTGCDRADLTEPNIEPSLQRGGNRGAASVGSNDLFLTSAIDLDLTTGNITLPLYKGQRDGETVWYIVTESSNQDQAERLGVNFAPKLNNALGTAAVQNARFVNANTGRAVPARPSLKSQGVVLDFDGTVDFSPERIVVPGPEGFPPAQFQAGAVGDADYSPLVTLGDGMVLNASHIANATGIHDAVVRSTTSAGR